MKRLTKARVTRTMTLEAFACSCTCNSSACYCTCTTNGTKPNTNYLTGVQRSSTNNSVNYVGK